MSLSWFSRPWAESGDNGALLLLHLALADSADDDGEGFTSWPHLQQAARLTEAERQQALDIMKMHACVLIDDYQDGNLRYTLIPPMPAPPPPRRGGVIDQRTGGPNRTPLAPTIPLPRFTPDTDDSDVDASQDSEAAAQDDATVPAVPCGRPVGYVYLLGCGPYYKIGQARQVDRRVTQLTVQLPHKPQVLHTIPTNEPTKLERSFHEPFAVVRFNGEWFALTEAQVTYIQSFMRAEYAADGWHYFHRAEPVED